MKTLLTIDHLKLLVPNKTNLGALLKALQQAKRVKFDYNPRTPELSSYAVDEAPNISVEIIKDSQVRDGKK